MIGGTGADRSRPAWRQVYRSVEHRYAKNQCKNQDVIGRFPDAIEDFANAFISAQDKRHAADYDPDVALTRSEVQVDIAQAETAISAFEGCSLKDRRAFAAWVIFKHRP
ncbi:MAG: hypothetical protein JKP98_15815 [Rhodobacteraceae bacterium]|jgi:hypothetical protein|nr:MAG: hypothetical protein N838_34040 [Thiohalocapsa sp. PB-PSB1]MBL4542969.1 hypothetical protein [Paracoccaceae bacterium]MBL4558019.1 hypothetical protein [Paracoccaceae bacterium]HBG98300.1 hypothetical protein [Paracoccaceae bacterium]